MGKPPDSEAASGQLRMYSHNRKQHEPIMLFAVLASNLCASNAKNETCLLHQRSFYLHQDF
ncbi:hypothetical protein AT251_16085 [Enterovibrio nigricans]|nr:hypothetical protein AT251_16085 [Enterovibrio nigricans]